MKEIDQITFDVELDRSSGLLVATWEDPVSGGITTQAKDVIQLQKVVKAAVRSHFEEEKAPRRVLLHLVWEQTYIPVR
jgi:hypothetical protein